MIDSNREEFEKWCYQNKWNTFRYPDNWENGGEYCDSFVNGAWYAFQEQQKKLDCCREENKAHLEKINEAITRCKFLKTNGGDRRTLEDIELILKGNKDEI